MTAPDRERAIRASDRWVTPGVVCVLLLVTGVLVLAVIGSVTFLQAQGRDPEPMLKLVAQAVTACGAAGGFVLQLLNRSSSTKAERNSGEAANYGAIAAAAAQDAHAVALDTQDAVTAHLEAQAAQTGYRLPMLPPVPSNGAAPAGTGSQ